MRTNIYKEKIISLLKKRHLLTIAEIHKAIPSADYSTIFRNVENLLKDKDIKKVVIDNKTIAYESAKNPHDHFVCNDCGGVEPVHFSIVQKNFKNKTISDVTVRGTCIECNKQK